MKMGTITVNKIWLTETAIWIQTTDGREAHENFADYQRLRYATQEQRKNFTSDQFGIHWEDLDEDFVPLVVNWPTCRLSLKRSPPSLIDLEKQGGPPLGTIHPRAEVPHLPT